MKAKHSFLLALAVIAGLLSGAAANLRPGSGSMFLAPPPPLFVGNPQFFPSDANFFNVQTYGAKGDGVTNDLGAIQAAFTAAVAYWKTTVAGGAGPTVFFPAGTYLVNDSIRWVTDGVAGTAWQSGVTFQGSGQVTIKLADNLPAFQSVASPLPLLWVASQPAQGPNTDGAGNAAFYNYIFDVLLDVGKGNPGAIGVAWQGNNISGMENVLIRSSDPAGVGYAGITDFRNRYAPGPSLFKNVTVVGFNYGILWTQQDYSITCDGLTLVNQIISSVANGPQVMGISRLTAPRFLQTPDTTGEGQLTVADTPSVFFTLPVSQTPSPAINSSVAPSDFLKITADNTGVTDATAAINTALADTTHSIAYLPFGIYKITDTLVVPSTSTIRRFMGNGAELLPDAASFARNSQMTADFSQGSVVSGFGAPGGAWDNTKFSASLALSNSNLTVATINGASQNYHNAFGTVGKSTGKWFYRFYVDFNSHNFSGQGNWIIGFTNSGGAFGNLLDGYAFLFGYAAATGNMYNAQGLVNTFEPAFLTGVVATYVDVAVDYDAQKFWTRPVGWLQKNEWNNDIAANQNPANGTGGVSFGTGVSGNLFPIAVLGFEGGGSASGIRPLLRFSGTKDLLVDRLLLPDAAGAVNVEHNSAAQLTLRHIGMGGSTPSEGMYRNTSSGTGSLFLEDISGGSSLAVQGADLAILHPQNFWARQLNPETLGTKILNAGGNLWTLGLKTEEAGTAIKTTTGGRSEVPMFFLYPLSLGDPNNAAFVLTDTSTGSFVGATEAYGGVSADYSTLFQTPSKTITHAQLPGRGFGVFAPLGQLSQ